MIKELENILGEPLSGDDIEQAFHHRSYVNEHEQTLKDNETLEFLGDAVLGLLIGELLFEMFPNESEGFLSKTRSAIVSEKALAKVARSLDLGSYLKLGKGEKANGGANKDSLLSDALEALWGAIYRRLGIDKTKRLTRAVFAQQLSKADKRQVFDAKTELQEGLQKQGHQSPVYKIIEEKGPDHDRVFVAAVYANEKLLSQAEGTSKKTAEQNAAKKALTILFNSKS